MIAGTHHTACIISTGCLSNLIDGSQLEDILRDSGYQLTSDASSVDLTIINTCAFNQAKEDEAVRLIEKSMARLRNGGRIVVCGCLPKINRDRLARVHKGITFGPQDMEKLPDFLKELSPIKKIDPGPISYTQYSKIKKSIYKTKRLVDSIPGFSRLPIIKRLLAPMFNYSPDICCIRVASGCTGICSYCAIRFAKGKCNSRPLSEIDDDKNRAIAGGYSKFVLVGDEITAYGSDLAASTNIFDVISLFLEDSRVDTIYLESFEPSFMIAYFDQVIKMLSYRKTPVFCSSVQSGSNRILQSMRRRYSAEDYFDCMMAIKRNFPEIYLRNELIVGFPGETEDDFQKSVQLTVGLRIDFVDVYKYEDRPNTSASRMQHKIPHKIKRQRRKKLLQQHWKNVFLKRRSPKTHQV